MKSFVVILEGQANGGSVTIRVIADGVSADTVQTTRSGQRALFVLDSIFAQMKLPSYDVPLKRVDRDGELLLIIGADSVQTLTSDPGLEISEQEFDGELGLELGVTGGTVTPALAQPARSGSLPASDVAVLGHLERMIGSLADGSAATPKLLKAALDAHRTFAQGTLALLTGTPLPVEPNPGNGGNVALDSDSAQSVLTGLANSSVGVLQAAASLSDARGQQLAAAADKEKEAKKGGSTTGQPGSTPGAGGGSGSGPGNGSTPTQSSGGPNTGQPTGATTPTQAPTEDGTPVGPMYKPYGAPDTAYEPLSTPYQIKVTTLAGMTFVRGYFPDGKVFLSSGQTKTVVKNPDGSTSVAAKFENFTIPIDDAKFEAMVVRFRKQIQEENAKSESEAGWHADWPKIASNILSALPVIGQIKTVLEGLLGVDLITWEHLDDSTRAIYLLTALAFSPVGARMFQGLKSVSRTALGALKTAIEEDGMAVKALASAETKAALTEAEQLAAQAAKDTAEKGIETEVREFEAAATAEAEQGCTVHVCFGAGTLVTLADSTQAAIETIRAGELVLTRSILVGTEKTGGSPALQDPPRHVARAYARESQDCLRLVFEGGSKTSEVVCTREHPFAVNGDFRPASRLSPGMVVDTRDGRGARLVSRETLSGMRPVFNIEIADGHTYFVTDLELWVHNQCEKASQKQMEGYLTKNNVKQPYVDANGNPVSEPAFYKGKYIGKGRADVQAEIDTATAARDKLEETFRYDKSVYDEMTKAQEKVAELIKTRGSMTFPDAVIVENGETVALELKTVKVKGGVEARFNTSNPNVDYGLDVMEQAFQRSELLPKGIKQVLVIDMRAKFPQLFKLTGPALKNELDRLMTVYVKPALSQGIWATEDAAAVKDMWTDVRFLTGPDGGADIIGGFSLK